MASPSSEARLNVRDVGAFAVVWLAIGFAAGTMTLLGPVRWVTTAMRDGGSSETAERLAVLAIIGVYVALSFGASMALHRVGQRAVGWRRFAPAAFAWSAALACLWLWMTPAVVNGFQPVQVEDVQRFTFGPYPERTQFEQLKADGYTAVVSLLHPAVVPFEPTLLAREHASVPSPRNLTSSSSTRRCCRGSETTPPRSICSRSSRSATMAATTSIVTSVEIGWAQCAD